MKNFMYAIKDRETGNFLSRHSFFPAENETWNFYVHTGKLGTDFFKYYEAAMNQLHELDLYNINLQADRQLIIDEVNPDELETGETIKVLEGLVK